MNRIKTFLLLTGLTLIMMWIGSLIGGQQGMIIAFGMAVAMNFFSYWFSDRIVLKAYKAQPISEPEAPELYAMVRSLALEAGLPLPRICVIPSDTPNAFATGRNPQHAVVAVTRGIVNLLSPRELRGVLAHELSHIKNRDILIGSIAATMAGAIMILASMTRFSAIMGGGDNQQGRGGNMVLALLISLLAPLAAVLIQMAVSRSREYLADASGAAISHDPQALASALSKLEQAGRQLPMQQATPQTAHMFTVNPLTGGGLASLFSTHPPIEERVARLQQMAGQPPTRGSKGPGGRQDERQDEQRRVNLPAQGAQQSGGRSGGGKIDWS